MYTLKYIVRSLLKYKSTSIFLVLSLCIGIVSYVIISGNYFSHNKITSNSKILGSPDSYRDGGRQGETRWWYLGMSDEITHRRPGWRLYDMNE